MIPYHAGAIFPLTYLFLVKEEPSLFRWYRDKEPTSCLAETPALAIKEAHKHWKDASFRLIHCGFRYSLATRDEVGCNAFFWQMAKSYAASNGHYFDEEAGHLCYVDFASQEALALLKEVQ